MPRSVPTRPCHASHPQRRAELMPLARLTPSCPRKTVRRDLESARAKVGVFCLNPAFFHPGLLGFFSRNRLLFFPHLRDKRRRHLCTVLRLRPHPVDNAGSALPINVTVSRYLQIIKSHGLCFWRRCKHSLIYCYRLCNEGDAAPVKREINFKKKNPPNTPSS